MPSAWVAINHAARNQVRRDRWLPCSTVPAVTETCRSQAAHWSVRVGSIAKCESPTFAGVCPSETLLARTYRQLDLDERRTLFRLIEARRPIGEIAERLGRHPSTIYRELGRNRFRDGDRGFCGYFPLNAQDLARRRRKLAADDALREHVVWARSRAALLPPSYTTSRDTTSRF